jgi:hypothetical protein
MAAPNVKLISLSNVYTRMMHFVKKGDVELGHKHTFDHATLVSSGSVLYEVLDDHGKVEFSKVFQAPDMVYVSKDRFHRITSLEDDTVCGCIHAIRAEEVDIIPPDSLIEPFTNSDGIIDDKVKNITNKDMIYFTKASLKNKLEEK